MKNAILFLVLCAVNWAHAQDTLTIDSLQKVLETDISDRERVDVYNAIAAEYHSQDSATTVLFADQAIGLSSQIGYPEGISDAFYHIGRVTRAKRDYPKAIELHEKALETARSASYKKGEAEASNGLGITYFYLGDYPNALE